VSTEAWNDEGSLRLSLNLSVGAEKNCENLKKHVGTTPKLGNQPARSRLLTIFLLETTKFE
jgi:hypothetical protein